MSPMRKRLWLAWHALRGHSIMYRVQIDVAADPVIETPKALVMDCTFRFPGRPGFFDPSGHTDILQAKVDGLLLDEHWKQQATPPH